MITCSWKDTLGVECFGCGFQRSIQALLEGDLWTSLYAYPATLPLLLTFSYTFAHLLFKYKQGARNIVLLFSFSVLLMVSSFIYKLVVQ